MCLEQIDLDLNIKLSQQSVAKKYDTVNFVNNVKVKNIFNNIFLTYENPKVL